MLSQTNVFKFNYSSGNFNNLRQVSSSSTCHTTVKRCGWLRGSESSHSSLWPGLFWEAAPAPSHSCPVWQTLLAKAAVTDHRGSHCENPAGDDAGLVQPAACTVRRVQGRPPRNRARSTQVGKRGHGDFQDLTASVHSPAAVAPLPSLHGTSHINLTQTQAGVGASQRIFWVLF